MKAMLLIAALCFLPGAWAQTLKLVQSIPLPGVEGRIDHMSLDAPAARLFLAALGNNTVEVVDLKTGTVVRSLRGFSEPQGVLVVPEFNRLYVANGGDGSVRILHATIFETMATVQFDDDADNVRYDSAAKQVFVGYGSGALGIIDVGTNTVVGNIPLRGHPESFQLETRGSRVFVNVPGSHTVTVVDRKSRQTIGHWSLGFAAANFPMALDEPDRRAFVACRMPARLLVFDLETGRHVATVDLHGDCDDIFYDATRHQLYASCGEGFLDVFAQTDRDHYSRLEALKTAARARTCLFVDSQVYLAVPKAGDQAARIEVYAVANR